MQNRKTLLCAMAALLSVLSGCKEDDSFIFTYAALSESSVVFDGNGATGSVEVQVFPEGTLWQADYDAEEYDWLTFECTPSGIEVTAQPNHEGESRQGTINVTSPEGKFKDMELKVFQEVAEGLEFSTSLNEYAFDSEGGAYKFTVESNYSWEVTSDASWLKVKADVNTGLVVLSAEPNASEKTLSAIVTVTAGPEERKEVVQCVVKQETRAENKYLNLLGKWQIVSSKWFYTTNGSLNSTDVTNPEPNQYCLIFDLVQDKYNETFIMQDFLYPGTKLQVRFDKETGGLIIPFGWSVYDYSVFFYVTFVGSNKFAFASMEAKAEPSGDGSVLSLALPALEEFNYVGFGLWTYNDNGDKVAFGYSSRPTMYPMSPIVFNKQYLETEQK